jgi:hypothetical protein
MGEYGPSSFPAMSFLLVRYFSLNLRRWGMSRIH